MAQSPWLVIPGQEMEHVSFVTKAKLKTFSTRLFVSWQGHIGTEDVQVATWLMTMIVRNSGPYPVWVACSGYSASLNYAAPSKGFAPGILLWMRANLQTCAPVYGARVTGMHLARAHRWVFSFCANLCFSAFYLSACNLTFPHNEWPSSLWHFLRRFDGENEGTREGWRLLTLRTWTDPSCGEKASLLRAELHSLWGSSQTGDNCHLKRWHPLSEKQVVMCLLLLTVWGIILRMDLLQKPVWLCSFCFSLFLMRLSQCADALCPMSLKAFAGGSPWLWTIQPAELWAE